jgi:aminoglycoside phosphotransferase family enzyme
MGTVRHDSPPSGVISAPQPGLIEAMMQPGFYPKPPAEVGHKETHISHLFFAGDLVFKIKKAVRFAFLDYGTLAKRRFFLNEELRLNRRLAPSVYIGVEPISCDERGWRLGGWGEPAEYVLVMRRLPDKRMLPFLLETNQVTAEMMRHRAGTPSLVIHMALP